MHTGLDHVAIGIDSASALTEWAQKLDELGVTYTPATETPIGTVIAFRDPDNIQIEFWLLRDESGGTLRPWEIEAADRCRSQLSAELDPTELDDAIRRGRQLPLADIVRLVGSG
jgi:hypothetical protein